jgi:hypothetical protein
MFFVFQRSGQPIEYKMNANKKEPPVRATARRPVGPGVVSEGAYSVCIDAVLVRVGPQPLYGSLQVMKLRRELVLPLSRFHRR